MSSNSSNAQEAAPETSNARPLVIAISHGVLRQWVVSELVAVWQGRVEIVDGPSGIFRALQGHDPVLLICGQQLALLVQDHRRRWTGVAAEITVVLVESLDRLELTNSQLGQSDAVLLWELHQGVALEIVRSAKSGIRAFPPELVDRLISGREQAAASWPRCDGAAGSSGGEATPSPASGADASAEQAPGLQAPTPAQGAAPGRSGGGFLHRLIGAAIARLARRRRGPEDGA